jgi:transposase
MQPGTDTEIKQKSAEGKQIARNRQYSLAFKRKVVRMSFAPGSSVSIVARRHDINSNIVFRWRKAFRDGKFGNGTVSSKKGVAEAGLVEIGLVDNAGEVRLLPAPREVGGEA